MITIRFEIGKHSDCVATCGDTSVHIQLPKNYATLAPFQRQHWTCTQIMSALKNAWADDLYAEIEKEWKAVNRD
jgi:hypothetical protein